MVSLAVSYDPRCNTLDAVRVGLALMVAVSHGIVMRTGDEPTWGSSTLGDLAVDGFFVLSGFLVTGSYQRIDVLTGHAGFWTVVRFGWHRFLRIMPGFWVCLLVLALVIAPLVAVLEGRPAVTPVRDGTFVVGFHLQQRRFAHPTICHRRLVGWKPDSIRL